MDNEAEFPEILTKLECATIVENAFNISESEFEVINFKVKTISDDALGYLGAYYALIITITKNQRSPNEQLKCFIKTLPHDNDAQKQFIIDLDVFERERIMYSTVFGEMDKYNFSQRWHGNLYYARKDILVFEDLKEAGFRLKAEDEEYTQKRIEITLKCIATMHANSIAFEHHTGKNIETEYGSYLKEVQVDPQCGWFVAGVQALRSLIDVHSKYQETSVKKFIKNNFDKSMNDLVLLTEPSKKFRNVFSHRDLWDKNIFFRHNKEMDPKEPTECILLDFQICRYNPPALDVLQFLYPVTTIESRKIMLKNYLQFYYNCLVEEGHKMGVNITEEITWNEFLESCEYVKLVPVVLNATNLPVGYLPDGYMNSLKHNEPDKYNQYIQKDRTQLVFEYMNIDKNYKKSVDLVVEEFVDYILEKYR